MISIDYASVAKTVINKEIACLNRMVENLDNKQISTFIQYLDNCQGKIIWCGIGKSGHICKKIVATMQSLGIQAIFLHPSEALHGDLGIVSKSDIVVAVSNSGETKELLDIIAPLKKLDVDIVSIVGRSNSTLESVSTQTLVLNGLEEVYLGIVPTSSTTGTLVMGDAISIAIASRKNFAKEDFGKYHPNGQLGKKLTLKVMDVMVKDNDNSLIVTGSSLEQAVFEMCRKSVSGVTIVDKSGAVKGIFTDGDLRRYMNSQNESFSNVLVDEVMTETPICIQETQLLSEAITSIISKNSVSIYPVVNKQGKAVGTLRMIDVVKSGLWT